MKFLTELLQYLSKLSTTEVHLQLIFHCDKTIILFLTLKMLSACPICTEIFTLNSKTSSTVCGHVFHKMCISKWLEDQNSCPRCRSDCNKNQLRRVYISENSIESLIPDLLLIAVKDGLTGQFFKVQNETHTPHWNILFQIIFSLMISIISQ